MRQERCVRCAVLSSLFALGCAAQSAGTRDSVWDSESPDAPAAVGEVSTSEQDQEDIACARQIRADSEKLCGDAPPTLPEAYAERARRIWQRHTERCPGMRSRAALRELDECVTSLEEAPNQVDMETQARRDAARAKLEDLRADPLFAHARRRVREAREEASLASQDYEQAYQRGAATAVRFRAEAWEQAEKNLQEAEGRLLELIVKHGIDPRDARALGVW
ncbi:MAG: hypothetical protein ACOX6T_14325 [Myxococcales bacterium]|jgi:DNA-binding transcriptional regulator YiaG